LVGKRQGAAGVGDGLTDVGGEALAVVAGIGIGYGQIFNTFGHTGSAAPGGAWMDSDNFTGRVALVTGGARRLGAGIVRELHARGMRVVVHYRESETDAVANRRRMR